ncbi:hypothetical protein ABZU75_01245 [Streptosporangium sp. NPDC005286]|uniref:hypothetical protein n=1 Tax=Streptosporangium sp. NPDC005286 TaxID=3154463 RepID=UPI0033AD2630
MRTATNPSNFCEALGADRIGRRGFHPFFHEIVEVRQAGDPGEPPSIVEERWPGYMMGSMLLTRAGVVVTAGARHLVARVADRSTLYWTFWRRSRSTNDPSHGWGHNSQWATGFRRDYLIDGRLHYNVDEVLDPSDDEGGRRRGGPRPGVDDRACPVPMQHHRRSRR